MEEMKKNKENSDSKGRQVGQRDGATAAIAHSIVLNMGGYENQGEQQDEAMEKADARAIEANAKKGDCENQGKKDAAAAKAMRKDDKILERGEDNVDQTKFSNEGNERAAVSLTITTAQFNGLKFVRKNRNSSPSMKKTLTSPERRSLRAKSTTNFFGRENNTQKSSITKGKRKKSGDNIAVHPTSKENDTVYSLPLITQKFKTFTKGERKKRKLNNSHNNRKRNDSGECEEIDKSQSSSSESSDDDDDNSKKKIVTEMINATSRQWKNETSITSMFAKLAITCTMQAINPSDYSNEERDFVHKKFDEMKKCFQILLDDKLANVTEYTNNDLVSMGNRIRATEDNVQKILKTRYVELKSKSKNELKSKLKTETSTSSSNDIVSLLESQSIQTGFVNVDDIIVIDDDSSNTESDVADDHDDSDCKSNSESDDDADDHDDSDCKSNDELQPRMDPPTGI